jgi:hypothetical protein
VENQLYDSASLKEGKREMMNNVEITPENKSNVHHCLTIINKYTDIGRYRASPEMYPNTASYEM